MVQAVTNSIISVILAGLLATGSLAVHPHHIIGNPPLRLFALITLPFMNGGLMVLIGWRFARAGRRRSDYEHFVPAFVFSLVFGAIRYIAAK